MPRRLVDLKGQRFGRLAVVERAAGGQGISQWLCVCDCGRRKTVSSNTLKSGNARSCGCLNSELSSARNSVAKRTHGLSKTRAYRIWIGIHRRCEKPQNLAYHYYGGRGIEVCPEWADFPPFFEWCVANGYADDLQIDRINNDGPYSPDNCRWTTAAVNAANRRPPQRRQNPCDFSI